MRGHLFALQAYQGFEKNETEKIELVGRPGGGYCDGWSCVHDSILGILCSHLQKMGTNICDCMVLRRVEWRWGG